MSFLLRGHCEIIYTSTKVCRYGLLGDDLMKLLPSYHDSFMSTSSTRLPVHIYFSNVIPRVLWYRVRHQTCGAVTLRLCQMFMWPDPYYSPSYCVPSIEDSMFDRLSIIFGRPPTPKKVNSDQLHSNLTTKSATIKAKEHLPGIV